MASNNIQFSLASKFDGEGFKNATKAIKDNQKEIQASAKGLGELSKAFADVSPEAATAVQAVKNLGAAFAAGGIVGGVIELAIRGISFAVGEVKEYFEKAAEATKKYAEILKNDVLSSIGDATAKFNGLKTEMTDASREAKDLLNVLNGQVAHEAANKVYELHVQTINSITDTMTETEKAVILAEEARQAAIIKATAAEEQAANTVSTMTEQVRIAGELKAAAATRAAEADEALAKLNEQCSEYLAARTSAENYLATQEERFAEGQISLQEVLVARKDTSLKIAELEETYKTDVELLKKATNDAEAAKKDVAAADYAVNQANNALTAAVQRRTEAEHAVTTVTLENEMKVSEAKKKDVEAKEKLTAAEEKAADDWHSFLDEQLKKLNDATEGLAEAEDKASESLEDWVKDENDPTKKKKKQAQANASAAAWVKVEWPKEIGEIPKPKKLDDATWERFKNGTANVADMERVKRFQEMDKRFYMKSDLQRIKSDVETFLTNAQKPDSWLSTRDKEFQRVFKTEVLPQLPKDVAEQLLGDANAKVLSTESMKEILSSKTIINAWLGSLGLK